MKKESKKEEKNIKKEKISIVVPYYNEQESLPIFYEEITKIAKEMKEQDFEFVFVNDGSKDNTLKISDSGIGINEKDLPRIFEKGYTGFNGRLNQKSSGLGLYLVKRSCDMLDHQIKIESKLNIGTDVYLSFNENKTKLD